MAWRGGNTGRLMHEKYWRGEWGKSQIIPTRNWRSEESMKRDNCVILITAQGHEYQVHGRIVIQ